MTMRIKKILNEVSKLGSLPLSYKIGKPVVGPSVANIYLTKKCNSRCRMCNFWNVSYNSTDELSMTHIRKIFFELRQLGIQFLSLGAEGEIFTRSDACEVFREAREFGFDFAINTNGLYLPEDFVRNVHELGPYLMVFGLDTTDQNNYEEIRGIPKGLEKALSSIRRLIREGYSSISIGSVVLHNNLQQLPRLCRLAQEEGIQNIRFTAFLPVGFGKSWKTDELSKYYDPLYLKDLRRAIHQLMKFKQQYGIVSNTDRYLAEIPKYYEARFRYLPFNCMIGYHNLQIAPNGDVTMCCFRGPSSVIGNAKQDNLVDLWYSEKANSERSKIKNGSCPTCWLSCYAETNMRFSLKAGLTSNMEAFRRSRNYKL